MHLVPESRHQQLLFDLAFNLKGVIAQQLVPTIDGNGRRAAFEILLGTPVVKDTLLKGNLGELKDIMKQSREAGMVTFDQSLFELYSEGVISYDDALKFADSANEVRLKIKLANGTTDDDRKPCHKNIHSPLPPGGGFFFIEQTLISAVGIARSDDCLTGRQTPARRASGPLATLERDKLFCGLHHCEPLTVPLSE